MPNQRVTAGNVHDWEKVLACTGGDNPYDSRSWQHAKQFVGLCVKFGTPGPWVDLGCGLGFFVECCQRYGIPCTGFEGDPNAPALVEKRHAGLRIELCDLCKPLPIKDESVAVAFCNQVLEHLPPESTGPFLADVRRCLKPGGLFFVNMPSKYNSAQRQDPGHINLMGPSQLNAALARAGFETIWPANYPRFFLGKYWLAKLLCGILYFALPLDVLSSTATALAFAGDKREGPVIRGARYFHLKRALSW